MNYYEATEQLLLDVAALQTQMTSVQTSLSALSRVDLTEGADILALDVGHYTIPSTAVCATLINRPPTNTATADIDVVPGGASGQKMIYYRPCAKEGASYWQAAYYEGSWGQWHEINVFDSGWIDLPLNGNTLAFNEEQKPRYRRIGKEVFITGVVKNVSANETLIATLPVNYRPSKKIIIAIPSTGMKFSRISIHTNGAVYYEQSNDNSVMASHWHSLACSFVVA